MHFVLSDSLALVDALCDADVLAIQTRLLKHFVRQTCFADSLALVDALCDALVLADSDALVEALWGG